MRLTVERSLYAAALVASGCLAPTTGSGGGSTTSGGQVVTMTSSSTPASGSGCATDPTTGVSLCSGISLCPTVKVDPTAFPDCGFLINGTALDLECLCTGYLCPIGAPSSCAAAEGLLQSTNEGAVCNAIAVGGCTALTPSTGGGGAGGSAGGGSSGSSGCDEACYAMCGGSPDCIQMCGC